MKTPTPAVLGRTATALALAAALGVAGVGVAGASSLHRSRGHDSGGTEGGVAYALAVSATSLSVEAANGVTTTYTLTGSTTYTEGGQAATASALVVGDRVKVDTAPGAPTTATSVQIELAEIHGIVLSASGSTILVIGPEGFTRTVSTGGSTAFTLNGQAGTFASVVTGERIVARGTIDANGTSLDALSVALSSSLPNLRTAGVVTALTPGVSVTVSGRGNTETTFTLTGTTTYTEGKTTVPSTDLLVNDHVVVTVNASAPTTAVSVDISPEVVSGTVGTAGSGTFTVSGRNGASTTVVIEPTTKWYVHGQLTALVALTSGMRVTVSGLPDANGTSLDAQTIVVSGGWGLAGNGNGNGNGQGQGNGGSGHRHGRRA